MPAEIARCAIINPLQDRTLPKPPSKTASRPHPHMGSHPIGSLGTFFCAQGRPPHSRPPAAESAALITMTWPCHVRDVDPVTLFALVSCVEAFVSAGLPDPYELYQYVHVSEVVSTANGRVLLCCCFRCHGMHVCSAVASFSCNGMHVAALLCSSTVL